MNPLGSSPVCRFCGHDNAAPVNSPVYHLPCGTQLHGRYVIGRALGEGGFGITYIGMDTTLSKRVAVKEFYPSGIAVRDSTVSAEVQVSDDKRASFDRGVERFLFEAKSVAAFTDEDGIVDVQDYFQENRTAYIVMNFLDGKNLYQYVADHGRFSFDKLIALLTPVMRALRNMHSKGIIHRDISPDNIMFTTKGVLKLTDFGSAKYFSGEDSPKTIVLKQGYAPEEQYLRDSEQGPFTDVYALCATIYYCITGKVPVPALKRNVNDILAFPSQLGADIRPSQEKALMHGLAVHAADRTPDMDALIAELTQGVRTTMRETTQTLHETTAHKEPLPDGEYENRSEDNAEVTTKDYVKTTHRLRPFIQSLKPKLPTILLAGGLILAVAAVIVFSVLLAGKGEKVTPDKPTAPAETTINIKELLSGIDTHPSERATYVPPTEATTAPVWTAPLTETEASQHIDELKDFFFDNVVQCDTQARFSNFMELHNVYYCTKRSDTGIAYIAYVYRNNTANYYKVLYIPADRFSVEQGKLVSRDNRLTACEGADTMQGALGNCWILGIAFRQTQLF